jgi:hypothetical protein
LIVGRPNISIYIPFAFAPMMILLFVIVKSRICSGSV